MDASAPDADSGPERGASCENLECDLNATCEDADGTPQCRCAKGFEGDGKTCTDVDECEDDNGGCDERAICVNHKGGFVCLCNEGLTGDGETCTDPNECAEPELNTCDPNAACTDTDDGFSCECGEGVTGDGAGCADVDECAAGTDDCVDDSSCVNTFGGFACACDPGFTGDGKTECTSLCEIALADTNKCAPNAVCHVEIDEAVCEGCKPGYVGNGTSVCDAKDDCPEACDGDGVDDVANLLCDGPDGNRTCNCAPGYSGSEASGCTEIDECATNNGGCGDEELYRCVNLPGGYFCACQPGYELNASDQCVNIDECARGSSLCHPNAVCTDTDGGFECECKPGFSGDGKVCRDIDECEDGEDNCLKDGTARCINKNGSFECRCLRGYAGDGVEECENVDECEDSDLNACDKNAICTDKKPKDNPVGYECECKEGLSGDGRSCGDVNECKNAALNDCAENATCVNDPGGYHCECRAPFAGDDPDHCYCDLSGYWGLRQDLDTCWCDRDLLDVTIISAGTLEASVWELHRYTYDGETLKVDKGGCGADNHPDLISPFFGETYSSYIPDEALEGAGLVAGVDVEEPGIVPGRMFTTRDEGAVAGIDLGDDPACKNCFPVSFRDVNEPGGPPPAWVDFDEDGEPGLTLWPRVPSNRTDASRPDKVVYYNYLPVDLDANTSEVTKRAGCVSVATRFVTRLEADVQTCDRIVGEVIQVRAEGRVRSCTVVPKSDWDDDIDCSAADWSEADRCTDDDVQRLDEQNQAQTSKARFELVKLGDLDEDISCADVKQKLPAIPRTTPTPLACDCP